MLLKLLTAIHPTNMRIRYFPFVFLAFLAFLACKVKNESNIAKHQDLIKTICPEGGECSIQLQKDKKLLLLTEEATGQLYPEVTIGNNLVVVFTYTHKTTERVADGNYSETIHFEIPRDFTELKKKNSALTDVHLLFGKHCFCEDAGYYAISNGELLANKLDSKIRFELTFETPGIDSKIYRLIETIDLE